MDKLPGSQNDKPEGKASICYGVTNPKWLSIKVQYYFHTAGVAAFAPFVVLFYASLGLTVPQVGMIEFLSIAVSTVSRPVIGGIADKSGRHSLVLGFCIIGAMIPSASLGLFSAPTKELFSGITLMLNETDSFQVEVCDSKVADMLSNATSLFINMEPGLNNCGAWQLSCGDLPISNRSATLAANPQRSRNCTVFSLEFDKRPENSLFNGTGPYNCRAEFQTEVGDNTRTFIWISLLRSCNALFFGAGAFLTDSITYGMLGPQRRGLWGQQRMFATLAWGVTAGIMGVAIDFFRNFKICFATSGLMCVFGAIVAFSWLPKRLDQGTAGERVPFCKALRVVLVSPVFCILCLVTIASGMLISIFLVIWPQHMGMLGAPKLFLGLAAATICTFEVPSLFFAGPVVDRIGAPVCFLVSFLAYTIRYGTNAFLTPETAWIAIPVEILHIFCFPFFYAGVTRIAATIAPPGTASTVQSIVATCYGGIGTGTGVLLGSLVLHSYGRRIAFLIYAAYAFSCFLVLLIVHFVFLKKALDRVMKPLQNSVLKEETKPETIAPAVPLMNADFDEL